MSDSESIPPDEQIASDAPGDPMDFVPPSPAPPSAPRPIAPAVARRLWLEPHVRFWWVLAVVLGLGVGYLAAIQLSDNATETRLIREGTVVQATVKRIQSMELPGHDFPPDSDATLDFDFEGQPHEVFGQLAGRKKFITTGELVPLRINPQNPTLWTGRLEPAPMVDVLLGPLIALPSIPLALFVAVLLYTRARRRWRNGEAWQAVVVKTQPTPLAPRIGAAKCTALDGSDPRVFTIHPRHRVQAGDVIWVVSVGGKSSGALAAGWFV